MRKVTELLKLQGQNYILPLFWQHGENEHTLREYVGVIQESGIQALCIEARPHPEYIKDKWWKDLDAIIDECKKRKMKVWIVDDSHFPTGFANGRIKDDFPHLKKKYIRLKQLDFIGPLKRAKAIVKFAFTDQQDEILGIYLAKKISDNRIDETTICDISSGYQKDTVTFDLPEGQWRVLIVVKTFIGGEKETEGYLNPMDPNATDILIDTVYEAHYKRYHHEFGKTIAGFFSDEPRFGNADSYFASIGRYDMVLPWRDDLLEILNERMGGDVSFKLPLLFIDGEVEAKEIRYEYMNLVSTLYAENFSNRIGKWCRNHHVEYIGHVIEDNNAHSRLGYGSGHFFRALKGQDMSGIDVVLHQIMPGQDKGYFQSVSHKSKGWDGEFFHYALAKLGSSLGHLDPLKKGRTMCEIFGAYGWAEGLKTMKWLTDHMLVRGVNYFVPHAFSPKAYPDPDHPPHFYAYGRNPQFKDFGILMNYMNNVSHLLSDGKSASQIGIVYHAEAEWAGEYMLMQKPAKVLTQNQLDFEFVPIDYILDAKVEGNQLVINNYKFKVFIIPYSEALPKMFLEKTLEISKNGIEIYFLGGYPKRSSNGNDIAMILKELKKSGCSVITLENLIEELNKPEIRGVATSSFEPYLRLYQYHHKDGCVFMFVNENPYQEINTKITIKKNLFIYQYDAFKNETSMVENIEKERGKINFSLNLSPYESKIMVTGQENPKLENSNYRTNQVKSLRSDFQISFANALDYPKFSNKMNLSSLNDMSEIQGKESFSGTIRYEKSFNMDNEVDRIIIEFKEAYETVVVYLNGKLIDKKICPPYKFLVNKDMLLEENKLIVDVTNTLVREQLDFHSQFMLIEPCGIINEVLIHFQTLESGSS